MTNTATPNTGPRRGLGRTVVRAARGLLQEMRARRLGRRGVSNSIGRAARDVTGPTGWVFSNAWDELDKHGDAYMKSFDRRIPPSLFVSERDRTRFQQPMPIAERCLEDHHAGRRATADTQLAQLPLDDKNQ